MAGRRRQFGEGTTSRHIVAECLASRNPYSHEHGDIGPAIWAEAGAVIAALRAAGFTIKRSKSDG